MNFTNSRYDGEVEIREVLTKRGKFIKDPAAEQWRTFREKAEQRLFTQQLITWSLIKERAATNPAWQWHHHKSLEGLKEDACAKGFWRAIGDQVQKPPFEQETTEVTTQELDRDDATGAVSLRLTARHGNVIYVEVGGSLATTASRRLEEPSKPFRADQLKYSFLCVDDTGAHPTGKAKAWANRPAVKSGLLQRGETRLVELKALPSGVIRYTTNGADPRNSGGTAGWVCVKPLT